VIRALIRLALNVAVIGVVAEVLLARRRGGGRPTPVRMHAVIDAPIERVWTELVDIQGQPRWMHDMKSVTLEDGPLVVGRRGHATVRMYGVALTDPVHVLHLDAPTRFGVSHDGVFAGHGIFHLEPLGDGSTDLRWEEDLVAPVAPHLVAALTAPVFRRVFDRDLDRFKALVEGSV
jgi:hypothetical protein